jgi:hypothetical protein
MTKQEKSKEPLSPSKRKELRKRKEDKKTKQYLTHDFAYTGIPGAKATAKGVRYRVNNQSGGLAGMRRFNRGGKV